MYRIIFFLLVFVFNLSQAKNLWEYKSSIQFSDIASSNYMVFAAKGDSIFSSVDDGMNWKFIYNSNHVINKLFKSQTGNIYFMSYNELLKYNFNHDKIEKITVNDSEWGDLSLFLDFHASGENMIIGSGGNVVYYSSDSGKNWKIKNIERASGQPNDILAVGITKNGYLLAAANSNGAVEIFYSDNKGDSWDKSYNGDIKLHEKYLFNISESKIYFYTYIKDKPGRISQLVHSSNDGKTWQHLNDYNYVFGSDLFIDSYNYLIFAGVLLDDNDKMIDQGLFKSKDNGSTWEKIWFWEYSDIYKNLAIGQADYFYMASEGGIYKSSLKLREVVAAEPPLIKYIKYYICPYGTLTWKAVEDNKNGYEIQLSPDEYFNDLYLSATSTTNSYQYELEDVLPGDTIYIRIGSLNSADIAFYSNEKNLREIVPIPDSVELTSINKLEDYESYEFPVRNEMGFMFDWYMPSSSDNMVEEVNIVISEDPSFVTAIFDSVLSADDYYTMVLPGNTLLPGLEYYFKARIKNCIGWSEFSDDYKISTLSTPQSPSLISPVNNTSGLPMDNIEIIWDNNDISCDSAKIQISKTDSFSNIKIDTVIKESGKLNVNNLDTNTAYYWKVALINGSGIGDWSDFYKFTVGDYESSVHENETKTDIFKLSPIPADDYLIISLKLVIMPLHDATPILIFNILGEAIDFKSSPTHSGYFLDVSHLIPGTYYLRYMNVTKCFIKN